MINLRKPIFYFYILYLVLILIYLFVSWYEGTTGLVYFAFFIFLFFAIRISKNKMVFVWLVGNGPMTETAKYFPNDVWRLRENSKNASQGEEKAGGRTCRCQNTSLTCPHRFLNLLTIKHLSSLNNCLLPMPSIPLQSQILNSIPTDRHFNLQATIIMGSETFLEIILAILLPPVGVFLRYGCGVIIYFLPISSPFFYHLRFIYIHSFASYGFADRVLDRLVADNLGIYTWNYIRNLCVGWVVEDECLQRLYVATFGCVPPFSFVVLI